MKRLISALIVLIVAPGGLVLHLRNHQPVTFDYYFGAAEWPLSWIAVLALGTGFGIGLLASAVILLGQRRRRRDAERRQLALERELDSLRDKVARDVP